MRVAVIGTGRMGRGFVAALAPVHDVVVGSRTPQRAQALAARLGAAAASNAEAAAGARVVVLCVPWPAVADVVHQLGDLSGVVVLDVSFPHNAEQREALRGRSSAEVLQRLVPGALVVKGFNHVFAAHLTEPVVGGVASSVLLAGDDAEAKDVVAGLARDMGFHPVDVGPLRATRDVEKLVGTMTFVRLGRIRVLS